MTPLRILYEHFINAGNDNSYIKHLWAMVEKNITHNIPIDNQQDFNNLLEDLADASQFQGFTAGFCTAVALCLELKQIKNQE